MEKKCHQLNMSVRSATGDIISQWSALSSEPWFLMA